VNEMSPNRMLGELVIKAVLFVIVLGFLLKECGGSS